MPLIIHQQDEERWLDPALSEERISSMLCSYPAELTFGYTVGKKLSDNSLSKDIPEILHPFDYRLSSVPVAVPAL